MKNRILFLTWKKLCTKEGKELSSLHGSLKTMIKKKHSILFVIYTLKEKLQ